MSLLLAPSLHVLAPLLLTSSSELNADLLGVEIYGAGAVVTGAKVQLYE